MTNISFEKNFLKNKELLETYYVQARLSRNSFQLNFKKRKPDYISGFLSINSLNLN